MNMSRNFLFLQSLREVGVGSTSCNGDCNKNVARDVHCRACYTRQRFWELVSQRRNEIARQVARKISYCNSAFSTCMTSTKKVEFKELSSIKTFIDSLLKSEPHSPVRLDHLKLLLENHVYRV